MAGSVTYVEHWSLQQYIVTASARAFVWVQCILPSLRVYSAQATSIPRHNMSDAQKEAFRKYLDSAGVIDALTKVLVSLYEEPDKPKLAVDYVKSCLGGPTPAEFDSLAAEREALKKELDDARQMIADLQSKVQALETAAQGTAA